MSLYSEYLDKKSELLSKELNFKTAVGEWLDKNNVTLAQPIEVEPSLTMDHIAIATQKEFETKLSEFEETFEVTCVRIVHNEVIIPDGDVKDVWKFIFKEKR